MPRVTFKEEEDQDTMSNTNVTDAETNANTSSMIFSDQNEADFGNMQQNGHTSTLAMETWFPIFSIRNIVALVSFEVLILLQLIITFVYLCMPSIYFQLYSSLFELVSSLFKTVLSDELFITIILYLFGISYFIFISVVGIVGAIANLQRVKIYSRIRWLRASLSLSVLSILLTCVIIVISIISLVVSIYRATFTTDILYLIFLSAQLLFVVFQIGTTLIAAVQLYITNQYIAQQQLLEEEYEQAIEE